jgi:SAM-dependent methyltransferase
MAPSSDIERRVGDYYTGKLREHGPTHRGVDWNSEGSQRLRFEQLLQVVDLDARFSINDWGCGYGALAEHLAGAGARFSYTGYDISDAMAEAARGRLSGVPDCSVTTSVDELPIADYTVASGIFNVLAGADAARWTDYVQDIIGRMAAISRRGIAFNMLTSYSDADKMRAGLHYADPCAMFDWCKRSLSRHVALLHDYGLWEFTMLVRFDEERQV